MNEMKYTVAATGEPVSVLAAQLDLIHKQLIAILTNAVERAFTKSPRFDMRQLLGGTAPVLQVGATLTLTLTLAPTRVYLLDEGLTEP